jgi:hypothetical protein
MNRLRSSLVLAAVIALGYQGAAQAAPAPEPQVSTQDQIRSTMSDRQVQTILTRIRTNAESMLTAIDGTRPRGRIFGRARQADDVAYLIDDLLQATAHMSDHVTRRITTRTDLDDLFGRADAIDDAMTRTPGSAAAQTAWRNIRRDIESLATAYSVTWDWQNPQYPGIPGTGLYQRLTGTYEIDTARSEDPRRVIDSASRSVSAADRVRVTRQLTRRLDPPDVISIDRNNRQVIIASSLAPQVTVEADGRMRSEQLPGGQTVDTRATLYGDQLEITTTGGLNQDFTLTFEPLNGGRDLQVTRRIYNDALANPVSLRTVYRRTSETPDWTLTDRVENRVSSPSGSLVPNGTRLTARLDQSIDLSSARDDDRVTLTVHNAPRAELEGATIEGYVRRARTSADATGGVVLLFDQIRLRNGRSSDFDGVIETMTGPNGETVPFDGEQTTEDRNRTEQSIERGAIGAAVGAILGAIVGGTKGAAIGAVVGGGGAVATVLMRGGQSQLVRGTDVTIRARTR